MQFCRCYIYLRTVCLFALNNRTYCTAGLQGLESQRKIIEQTYRLFACTSAPQLASFFFLSSTSRIKNHDLDVTGGYQNSLSRSSTLIPEKDMFIGVVNQQCFDGF